MSKHDDSSRLQRELTALRGEVSRAAARLAKAKESEAWERYEALRATTKSVAQKRIRDADNLAKAVIAAESSLDKARQRASDKKQELSDARDREAHDVRVRKAVAEDKGSRATEKALIRLSEKLRAEQDRTRRLEKSWVSPVAFATRSAEQKKFDVFISHAWGTPSTTRS